jgi:hypothetical protein
LILFPFVLSLKQIVSRQRRVLTSAEALMRLPTGKPKIAALSLDRPAFQEISLSSVPPYLAKKDDGFRTKPCTFEEIPKNLS